MLTEEQIKGLKTVDIIYLNNYPLSFHDTSVNTENIVVCDNVSNCGEDGLCWFSREYLTLQPQPKYDPCRPFKKGDRAQVVERNGRNVTCFPVGRIKVGDIVTVAENETGDVFIKVLTEDGHEMMAPWFMLKLVTPVEELEPYKLVDSPNTYNIVRDSATVMTIHKKSHPNAKAAAEAERDRLNAEFRKERNHV